MPESLVPRSMAMKLPERHRPNRVPIFAYPGSKGRLARRIISLMPRAGIRFVDVFAGRGNVTWAAMALCEYQSFWINDIQTSAFFKALAQIEVPYLIPELCGRKAYDEMRRWAEAKLGRTDIQVVHADYVDITCFGKDVVLAMNYPWAFLKRQNADKELPALLEGYLTFSGGNYKGAGYKGNNAKGGVSRAGFYRSVFRAKELLAEHLDSLRITSLDYREVLTECGPDDVVYLDPPYFGYSLGTYSDETLDHRELVRLLLNAKFKWVLSEYWNPIYAPLGEPIRILVDKPMANSNHTGGKRNEGIECLWTNFEPHYLTERNRMPKIDSGDLLAALQRERDDIDAAIRALTRTINKNFSPIAPDAKKSTSPQTKLKRKLSPQARKLLSEAAKKRWANRAKA